MNPALPAIAILCGLLPCGPAVPTAHSPGSVQPAAVPVLLEREPGALYPAAATAPAVRTPPPKRIIRLSGEPDPWFGSDKLRHFLVSFAATGYAQAGLRLLDVGEDAAIAGGASAALVAGLAKEFHDHRQDRAFSVRDLVWDVAGSALAAVVLSAAR